MEVLENEPNKLLITIYYTGDENQHVINSNERVLATGDYSKPTYSINWTLKIFF
jgi:hypothetical protein